MLRYVLLMVKLLSRVVGITVLCTSKLKLQITHTVMFNNGLMIVSNGMGRADIMQLVLKSNL